MNIDPEEYSDIDEIDDGYEPDPFEDAMQNCHGHFDRQDKTGVFQCGAVGSEDCDFECPFSRDLGMTLQEIEDRDVADMIAEHRQIIAEKCEGWFDASAFYSATTRIYEEKS